jgi:hypothetical protein
MKNTALSDRRFDTLAQQNSHNSDAMLTWRDKTRWHHRMLVESVAKSRDIGIDSVIDRSTCVLTKK